jgi:raffinose/stachyose/melibiose transport system substrate-binding protein
MRRFGVIAFLRSGAHREGSIKSRRKVWALTLAILAVIGLQSAIGAPIRIRFGTNWVDKPGSEGVVTLPILQKFKAAHPEFEFVAEVNNSEDLRVQRIAQASANDAPDIWYSLPGGMLADLAKIGAILDINQYLAKSKLVKKEDFPPAAWAVCSVDGIPRAIPDDAMQMVFMANKELFAKYNLQYPKTWGDFLAVGKEFRKHDVIPTNITSKGGNPSHFWYNELVCQYSSGVAAVRNLPNTPSFGDPAFLKAAQYIKQMLDAKMFPDDVVANGDWGPSVALYNRGNTAMCYTFKHTYGFLDPKIVEKSELIAIPSLPDGDVDPAKNVVGSFNQIYCINAHTWNDPKKQPGIILLMDEICTEMYTAVAQSGLSISASTAAMKRVDPANIPLLMMRKEMEYHASHRFATSPMIWQRLPSSKLQYDFQYGLDELWTDSITPSQYIDKMQKSFEAYGKGS